MASAHDWKMTRLLPRLISPAWVVARQAQDHVSDRTVDRRSTRPTMRVGPMLRDETTMPAKQRRRLYEKGTPAAPVQHPARGGEEHAIRKLEIDPPGLAPQDPQLMAQHHQLKILGSLSFAAQHQQLEYPTKCQIAERPQHHPPPRQSGSGTLRVASDRDTPAQRPRSSFPHPTHTSRPV